MDIRTFLNTLFHGDKKTKLLLWSSIACIILGLGFAVVFAFTVAPAFILGTVIALLLPLVLLKDYRFSDPENMKGKAAEIPHGAGTEAGMQNGTETNAAEPLQDNPADPLMAAILRDAGEATEIKTKKIERTPVKTPAEPSKKQEKPGKTEKEKTKDRPERSEKNKKPEETKNVRKKEPVDKNSPKGEEKPEKHKKKPEADGKKLREDRKKPAENREKPAKDEKRPGKVSRESDKSSRELVKKPEERSVKDDKNTVGAEKGSLQGGSEVREDKGKEPEKPAKEKHKPESGNKVQQKTAEKSSDVAGKDSDKGDTRTAEKAVRPDTKEEGRPAVHLIEADRSELKRLMVKYKVKREHRPVIIDRSEKYKIENCPAYLWVTRGKVHFLLMEAAPREVVLDYGRCTSVSYDVVQGNPAAEYADIRTNMALSGIFGACLPTYREDYVNRRRVSVKNLYVVGGDILLTNTSARAAFDLLKASFSLPERYMLEGLRGSYAKEAYKTKVLWQDGVINTSEFKARTKNMLQKMAKADISPIEYDNNLREMVFNQLITKEYADYYADAQK
jgi:hypothetical protein